LGYSISIEVQGLGSGFGVKPRGDVLACVGVWGSGFRVWGSGFEVEGLGFRVQDSWFRVEELGLRFEG